MTIQYEITPDDFRRFAIEAAKATTLYTVYTVILVAFAVLFMLSDMLLALVAIAYNDGSVKVDGFNMLPRLIIGWVIIGIVVIGGKIWGNWTFKKALAVSGKNGLFGEHTMTLDDAGVTESTEVSRNFCSWEGVEGLAQTPNFIALSVRLGSRYFIPKSSFSSKDDLHQFIKAAESRLPEESRTLTKELSL
jgi:hypothetical protein